MSKFLSILFAVILAGGVLGFLFVRAARQKVSGTTGIVPVRTDILQSDMANKIGQREVNGQIPVQVLPENYGRDDPFAPF